MLIMRTKKSPKLDWVECQFPLRQYQGQPNATEFRMANPGGGTLVPAVLIAGGVKVVVLDGGVT